MNFKIQKKFKTKKISKKKINASIGSNLIVLVEKKN